MIPGFLMADTALRRYLQLGVLVLVGGAIYPLIYLRQNFENSILESFFISAGDLGSLYAWLGVLFMLTYLPSGWLADRVAPRWLMSIALAMCGLLGLWFATMPEFAALRIIFIGWGFATGLLFWSALIKAVAVLAHRDEQGRFFGILDGGRGLVEAVLASIALAVFAYATQTIGQSTAAGLKKVILFYSGFMLLLAPVVLFAIRNDEAQSVSAKDDQYSGNLGEDLRTIARSPAIWLSAFCILCGYQLFWATYSFSAYLQSNFGMTAVAVGTITVAKLWMRPIGGVAAGFAGDFLDRENVLAWLMVAAAISLAAMVVLPPATAIAILLAIVLIVGFLTYAVKGLYWALLDSCGVDNRIKGLAIGVISLVAYSPDVYLPLINGMLLERFPGRTGYAIYFMGISVMGVLGALAAWRLRAITRELAS